MYQLNCQVVTPEMTAVKTRVDFVALPLYDGEIGIAPGRAPLIGRLGFGEMRLKVGGKVTRYYLDGGFVQVVGDLVSVLTSRAIPADQIDRDAAEEQLEDSRQLSIETDQLEEIRDRTAAQARAQIHVADRA